MQFWMWRYAWRHGLIDKIVEPDMYRFVGRNLLVVPTVLGVSILIAKKSDPTE